MKNIFKSEQVLIAEIHNEFDTAEDRLLCEAENLLKELKIPTQTGIEQKAERLHKIGFTNSEIVKKAAIFKQIRIKEQEKLVTTQAQAELIRYYKQTYPFQKFLTEQELNRICQKYSLVYAPVDKYLKDVPEKNLKEIENASDAKTQDIEESVCQVYIKNTHRTERDAAALAEILKAMGKSKSEFTYKECKELIEKKWRHCGENWNLFGDNPEMFFYVAHEVLQTKSYPYYFETQKIDRSGLFIAAPPSHFDLKGLKNKNKYGFFSFTITEVKDPIVFRYVRGGIQVLSKWGLEANDEALINEIDN